VIDRPVASFVRDAKGLLADVSQELETPEVLRSMLGWVNENRLPRRGVLRSGVYYSVHGAGCRFTLPPVPKPDERRSLGEDEDEPDGIDIDLDVSDARLPKFDLWRVRRYLESRHAKASSDTILEQEASDLISAGVIRADGDGWWAILP
jgi:hypothetical protein